MVRSGSGPPEGSASQARAIRACSCPRSSSLPALGRQLLGIAPVVRVLGSAQPVPVHEVEGEVDGGNLVVHVVVLDRVEGAAGPGTLN